MTDGLTWYHDTDEVFSNNSGRNEAYKLDTRKSIKDGSFFKRFNQPQKDITGEVIEDGNKYLIEVCTKSIALFEHPLEVNDAVKKLLEHSGLSKKIIIDMIKIEKNYIDGRRKDEAKKEAKKYFVKGNLKINDYVGNVEIFYEEQPFFYDKFRIFWIWNKDDMKYEIIDEIDLMNLIDKELNLYGQTITSTIKNNYIEAMKRIGRLHLPKEAPIKWIQFRDKAYSLESGNVYDVTPDYFFTNPIPHKLGTSESTPIMDKLFSEWVGEERKELLYQLLAYCCYREYPIQLLFCLYGNGRNGKSQFLQVKEHFIGKDNCTSVELNNLIDNRFESFKLYKKLVCLIGETDFSIIRKSSLIKKLVDGSLIGFEKKNKDPFEDKNYAKIVIASNSVPSSDDTSDGWYRRWLIIDFPFEFIESGHPIWKTIPEEEYSNLALKTCTRLRDLLKVGTFHDQGTIETRKEKYLSVSNPLAIFIKQNCLQGEREFESYSKVYTAYVSFLAKRKQRKVKPREFKSALEDEGFYVEKTTKSINGEYQSGYYIQGLKLIIKHEINNIDSNLCDNYDKYDNNICPRTSGDILGVGKAVTFVTSVTLDANNDQKGDIKDNQYRDSLEIINHKCCICNAEISHWWLPSGKTACNNCKNVYNLKCQ